MYMYYSTCTRIHSQLGNSVADIRTTTSNSTEDNIGLIYGQSVVRYDIHVIYMYIHYYTCTCLYAKENRKNHIHQFGAWDLGNIIIFSASKGSNSS